MITRRQLLGGVIGAVCGLGVALKSKPFAVAYLRGVYNDCCEYRRGDAHYAFAYPRQIAVSPEFYKQLSAELVPIYRKSGWVPNDSPADRFLLFKMAQVRSEDTLRGRDMWLY
jgi:hypothetical protein